MKVPAVLSVLAAAALTIVVDAAPASASAPRNSTHFDAKAFLASIPKYDYKLAEAMNARYDQALYGNRTIARTNGVVRAAAAQPVEILPYCVGIATDDKGVTRVQIFKNLMICDISGWTSLFTFTAHTKKDIHHAAYPICVGKASGPNRSMLFSNRSSCSISGWTTDFAFYESGAYVGDNAVSPDHHSTDMWQAYDPHRMLLYPYLGQKNGWIHAYSLKYRSRFRPASTSEISSLEGWMNHHATAHAQLKVEATPNTKTHRCVQDLIQIWNVPAIDFDGTGPTALYPGSTFPRFNQGAARDECSDLVKSAVIRAGRFIVSGKITVIEVMIGTKVHAALSLESGGWMKNDLSTSNIKIALQETL
ncbi:hypothetical protein BGZ95_003448 [Linnemannia exigua]|uniref:Uncharacterized protein n=1 Tax=Linnemannia exigua TaxID=604196 RepID=A0AAD4DIA6_9FUNG|nr:hypothetical protein BGZ95_003448 [Linnemannia exigua]